MNENIDLTKILKDCPKGWKFHSSIYGKVCFEEMRKVQQIRSNLGLNILIALEKLTGKSIPVEL